MRRVAVVALSLLLLTASTGFWHGSEAQEGSDLAGGWVVTSWTAPDGTEISDPQPGLFLFTATGQYSMMYVPGDETRDVPEGETSTDAETLEAYGSFIANSGRYTVDGNQIMYEAYVAKDPSYMADWNAEEAGNGVDLEFSITDGILTLEWVDGFVPGTKATLRRPGQG